MNRKKGRDKMEIKRIDAAELDIRKESKYREIYNAIEKLQPGEAISVCLGYSNKGLASLLYGFGKSKKISLRLKMADKEGTIWFILRKK